MSPDTYIDYLTETYVGTRTSLYRHTNCILETTYASPCTHVDHLTETYVGIRLCGYTS